MASVVGNHSTENSHYQGPEHVVDLASGGVATLTLLNEITTSRRHSLPTSTFGSTALVLRPLGSLSRELYGYLFVANYTTAYDCAGNLEVQVGCRTTRSDMTANSISRV